MGSAIHIGQWFEGDAVMFRDGVCYAARWVRPTHEGIIQLRTNDGNLLYFKPGHTWFQVMRPPEQQDPNEEGLSVA